MCEPVFSDEPYYEEGPVWSVQYIRTLPGMTRSYFANLKAEWRSLMEAAKKYNLILNYRVFLAPPTSPDDWDVMLTIEVKNMAVLDNFNHKLATVATKLRAAQPKQPGKTKPLIDVREILGMKLLREVTLT